LLTMRQDTLDRVDPLTRPGPFHSHTILLPVYKKSERSTFCSSSPSWIPIIQHKQNHLYRTTSQDHYSLARRVLKVCWAGIWSDAELKRTLKIGLFNKVIIGHLSKLYDRHLSDDDDDYHVPVNLVLHFLLATCTRLRIGICIKDRGWYPRDSDPDDIYKVENEESKRKTSRIYNKILVNVLKTLKVNED